MIEVTRDCPKFSSFCAVSKQKEFGPFFFSRHIDCLDMLEEFLMVI
jgi:hypothetical protein